MDRCYGDSVLSVCPLCISQSEWIGIDGEVGGQLGRMGANDCDYPPWIPVITLICTAEGHWTVNMHKSAMM